MSKPTWKLQPFPKEKAVLDLDGQFSLEDYTQLQTGYLPETAEDKWILYVKNDVLHIHRATTGYCIFLLQLQPESDRCLAPKVAINRNSQQYTCTDDQYSVELMAYLVDRYLLGRKTTPPVPAKINKQHHEQHQKDVLGLDSAPSSSGFISLEDLLE